MTDTALARGKRVTVRLTPRQVDILDDAVESGRAPNRSEALRDAIDQYDQGGRR